MMLIDCHLLATFRLHEDKARVLTMLNNTSLYLLLF